MRLAPAAVAIGLAMAQSFSVGTRQVSLCKNEPDEAAFRPTPRRSLPAEVELAIQVPLTLAEVEAILHWRAFSETRAEIDDTSLLALLRQARANLKRLSGLDLNPEDPVEDEDVL